MKLTLKFLIPQLLIVITVIVVTNILTVDTFTKRFLANKAVSISDHITREVRQEFTDADILTGLDNVNTLEKTKIFVVAITDPTIFRVKIWDKKGVLVYSDFKSIIGSTRDPSEEKFAHLFVHNSDTHWELKKSDGGASTEEGFGDYLEINVPVRDTSGQTYYLVSAYAATSAFLAGIQDSVIQVAWFWVLAGVIIFTSFYISLLFIIIRPVVFLRKTMELVGTGKLDIDIVTNSDDDIGLLYRNFNKMREQIKNIIDQLQGSKSQLEEDKNTLEQQGLQMKDQLEQLEKFRTLTVGRELKMIELKEELAKLKKDGGK